MIQGPVFKPGVRGHALFFDETNRGFMGADVGYYDDEYNPDGTFPVITYCDGSPQDEALSPYASSWSASGNDWPAEVGLAVDYNANGVRDELEPVIKSGHERWNDWGTDQTPSLIEPGYGPNNLDPSGDDYDPQFNPTGTEGDGRYQEGEPFAAAVDRREGPRRMELRLAVVEGAE